nr:hypothetical protein [Tanacetum cinerariifolium]
MTGDDNHDGDQPETSNPSQLNPPPSSQLPYTNGNGHVSVITDTNGMVNVLPLKTTKEVVAREKERKARTTLLMALPKDHLAKFHKMADAKEMWEAIKSIFGGNDESKKMQKYLLKQQFKGFSMSSSKGLHKGYDSFDDLYNNLRVFERDVKGITVSSSSNTQNVAFVLMMMILKKIDLKWNVSMISMRIKKFYKRTERKLQFDTKDTVGFDKTKVKCFNCYKMRHFARDCRAKWNQDIKRKEGKYNGNKARYNGRRPAYQDDSKALVTMDEEDIDWSGHVEEDTQNFAMMAYSSSNSGSENEVQSCSKTCAESYVRLKKLYDEQRDKLGDASVEITAYTLALKKSVFMNKECDLENTPVNDRYAKGMHAVPPPMIGTYMPSGPDVEIDYSKFTYGPKRTSVDKSDAKTCENAFSESDSSVETTTSMPATVEDASKVISEPNVLTDAPIIEEYESDSDDDLVSNVLEEKEKPSFSFTNIAKHVKTSRENVKETSTPNHYPKMEKQDKYSHARKENGKTSRINQKQEKGLKMIKREYSNARNLQQNGVAKRKNMTLIEATRTMLVDSFLPTTFWTEAVNTACYVLNRVLVTKPQNKTPYELLTRRQPIISYLRPFGCHVTIFNTIDQLGKFDGKSDLGFFVGYSLNSKAVRVYNLETQRLKENLHINFAENKPNVAGKGHAWMFDLDYLTNSMNYEPVLIENQANKSAGPKEANNSAGTQVIDDQGANSEEIDLYDEHFILPIWSAYSTTEELEKLKRQEKEANDAVRKEATHDSLDDNTNNTNLLNAVSAPVSAIGPSRALNDDKPSYPDDPSMPHLEDIFANPSEGIFTNSSYDDEGVVTDFNNLETSVNVSPTPTTRIHTIHLKTQILGDPMSVVQTRSKVHKNSEAHALVLVDLPFGKKAIGTKWVYRNKKNERGVVVRNKERLVAQGHRQEEGIDYDEVFAPVARIEAIRIFLAFASYMGFIVYQMDVKITFLYSTIDEEVYVTQLHGFIDPKFPNKVKQKEDGIYISQDKYVAKILKKFDFLSVKTASTPIETQKTLVKDKEAVDVDVHLYRGGYLKLLLPSKGYYCQAKVNTDKHRLMLPSCLNAKTTCWNEFRSTMALAIICLATNQKFNFSRYFLLSLVKNIEAGVPFYMFPSMKRDGADFSWVITPLFENMLDPAAEEVAPKVSSPEPSPKHQLPLPSNDQILTAKDSLTLHELLDLCTRLSNKVLDLESKDIDIKSSFTDMIQKLKDIVDQLEEENKALKEKSFKTTQVDTAAPVENIGKSFKQGRMIADMDEVVKINLQEDQEEPTEVEEVLEVVTAAKLMTEVVTTAAPTTSISQVTKASAPRKRRGVLIQDPEETAASLIVHTEKVEKEVKVKEEGNKRQGESLEHEIAKKQRIDEEAEDLKRHLQIVANDDDDDVYTEATLLASKVPIVDYQIHHENNKPYYKIIRADGTHKLFLSFITLLKNFNREDLEPLGKLIKERFETTEPKNFSDDFLLNILKIMFEKPNIKASVWKDQKGRYGLAKKYPLTHFNLQQMLKNVRLEVKEESEMSLELM